MTQTTSPATSPITSGTSGTSGAAGGVAAFAGALQREFATTLRVLRAFPAEAADFRPHERSNTALVLAWTFVIEARLMRRVLVREPVMGSPAFSPPPATWSAVMAEVESIYADLAAAAAAAPDVVMHDSVEFFVAPKQVGRYAGGDFLWFMLHDHIHHRGQLSVYVRMAGGKVPSIYGPSADEPWN